MDFAQFIELGKESGLTGKDLIDFAKEREDKQREEKQKERDERQNEREHQKQIRELELKLARERLRDAQLKSCPSEGSRKKENLPLFNENTNGPFRLDKYSEGNDIDISNRQPEGLRDRLGPGNYYDNVGIDKIQGDDQMDHSRAATVAARMVNNNNKKPISNKTLAWGGGLSLLDASEEKPSTLGFLEGQQVSVLRATGCSKIMAKAEFVDASRLLGKTQKLVLIDRTIREYPLASIWVDTPFYVGQVEALVVESPLCDLVLGNIEGVRDPEDPNPDWSLERKDSECSVEVEKANPLVAEVNLPSTKLTASSTVAAQSLLECETESGCALSDGIVTSPYADKLAGEGRSEIIDGKNPPGKAKSQIEVGGERNLGNSESIIDTSQEMSSSSAQSDNSPQIQGEASLHLLAPSSKPVTVELGRLLSWVQSTKTPERMIDMEIEEKFTGTLNEHHCSLEKYRAAKIRGNYTSRTNQRLEDYLRQATKRGRSKTSHSKPSQRKGIWKKTKAQNAKQAFVSGRWLRKLKAGNASDCMSRRFARFKFIGRLKCADRCIRLKLRGQGPHRVKLKRHLFSD